MGEAVEKRKSSSGVRVAKATSFFRGFVEQVRSTADLLFGCDVRALAVFRVSLGLVTLADLGIRFPDLLAHYTDFGVLPRYLLLERYAGPWEFSAHLFSGNWFGITAIFLVHAVCAAMLLVGFKTRFAVVACWVLEISLQNRNPMVLHSGDVLWRMLFFWAMFLPIGERGSVDAAFDPKPMPSRKRVLSWATMALTIQIVCEYFFAALHKVGPDWHSEGSAIYYALHVEQFTTSMGIWFRGVFAPILKPLTQAVWWFELIGPFFLFAPILHWQIRTGLLVALMGMHINFELLLGIGIFPFFCITGIFALFPSETLDRLAPWFAKRERTMQIIYDGDCLFCEKMAKAIRMLLALPSSKLRSSNEEPMLKKLVEQHGSWIVIDSAGAKFFRFEGFTALLAASPWASPLAWIARRWPMRSIGDRAYRFVAKRRSRLAPYTAALAPYVPQPQKGLGYFWGGFVALCLVFCVSWNIESLHDPIQTKILPNPTRWLSGVFRLDQRWNMFSRPIFEDGWLVIDGKTDDGRAFDVLKNKIQEVSYARPKLISATYPNERWQKYLMNLQMKSNSGHRLFYGRYLCRQMNVNRQGFDRLKKFEIAFMVEKVSLEGRKPAEKVVLWNHECY